ncbi:MAG TPA: condensation domain-containing protein [Mycobacterium sp.]|nr:condensation domain-containing protein [Mycobacterium sp.]
MAQQSGPDTGSPVALDHGPNPPLSLAQERVWFYDVLAPEAPFHNVPRLIAIRGPLQPELLARAMTRIVQRHHVLRCTYHLRNGVMVQQVNDPVPVTVPVLDLSGLREAERETELDRISNELVAMPFDLQTGPLMRGHLIRMSADHHVFLLDFHHIACDGWSERITLNEISALYGAAVAGDPEPLPELGLQYFDYAVWQRQRLASDAVRPHHEYWRGKLGDEIPRLELPTDRPVPLRRRYEGASMGYELDPVLAQDLRRLARDHNCTLYMLVLTAFVILLHRYTGQDDIVIGSPVNNREREEFHDLIGYFVTRLPLRADLSGNPTVTEMLVRMRRTVLEAFQYKDTTAERWPYPRADEDVRDSSNYQVMFFFQENPVGVERRFGGLVVTNANAASHQRVATMGLRSPTLGSQLDLGFFMEPVGERVFGWIEYATDIFDGSTVAAMRRDYIALLRCLADKPGSTIADLDFVDTGGQDRLAPPLPTAVDGYDDLVLPQLFADAAAAHPDRIALADGATALTYAALDARANALAHKLSGELCQERAVIGVVLGRSAGLPVSVLGVLRAGHTVMCLDPALPDARVAHLLDLAGAVAVVAAPEEAERFAAYRYSVFHPPMAGSPDAPRHRISGSDLAFVFATSGTTGEPKLVAVEHRQAAVGQLPAHVPYPLAESDVLLLTSPPGSARLVGEVFWPLLAGSRVAVAPDGPIASAQWFTSVIGSGATVVSVIPPLLQTLIEELTDDQAAACPLRLLQVLGEPVPGWLARRVAERLPRAELINSYAQTEACPALFWSGRLAPGAAFAPARRESALSIAYVLDGHGRPVPYNVPGDIYIAGYTVARGYLNDKDLTAAAFLPDPRSKRPGAHMFRTGDRGRIRRDGTLEVLGRMDNRVKVHGHSVAVEEVEAALTGESSVAEAMVSVEPGPAGDNRLIALVVPLAGLTVNPTDLRTALAAKIPAYMIPVRIGMVDSLPRTPNGKLDRTAVVALPAELPTRDLTPPRTDTERRILELWSAVLGTSQIDILDSFFELGGASLDGIRLVARVSREFNVEMDLRLLVEQRTVAGMAARVDELVGAS